MKKETGTKEWSGQSKNLFIGCKHNCRYCYGKDTPPARVRKKHTGLPNDTMTPTKEIEKKPKKYSVAIMFPTIHDIFPEHLNVTIPYLEGLLKQKNRILIVSKPHMECIKALCDNLTKYKNNLRFRFTISSIDNDRMAFWEPYAPDFNERFECLKYAYFKGYVTSVSCEPRFDKDMRPLVNKLLPYVKDTIWIGQLNEIDKRVDKSKCPDDYLDDLLEVQSVENTVRTYNHFKDNPKIRYKYQVRNLLAENGIFVTSIVNKLWEPYDVFIGRPSKWGNPFNIGKDGNRDEVIAKYRAYILSNDVLMSQLDELEGKRLGCYCKPESCHGDVLLEVITSKCRPRG